MGYYESYKDNNWKRIPGICMKSEPMEREHLWELLATEF